MKLQLKKGEIEKLQEKEKALSTMFSNLFLESNKFEPFLTKVYKKKVKRVKKTEQNAGSDEDSDEDLSDDDYDSEENEDSDAEELDDSVCPPGCDQVGGHVYFHQSFTLNVSSNCIDCFVNIAVYG